MSSNLGLGRVLTTIVYPTMVEGQMTLSSSAYLRFSWRKDMSVLSGHVSSIYKIYLLTEALRMEFTI
jgi:hypothetical protein